MISEVTMPSMGADMTEGTIVKWLKKEVDKHLYDSDFWPLNVLFRTNQKFIKSMLKESLPTVKCLLCVFSEFQGFSSFKIFGYKHKLLTTQSPS